MFKDISCQRGETQYVFFEFNFVLANYSWWNYTRTPIWKVSESADNALDASEEAAFDALAKDQRKPLFLTRLVWHYLSNAGSSKKLMKCIANYGAPWHGETHTHKANEAALHPVRIARIHNPRFVPRVGLRFKEIRTLSALRLSKGWVRKNLNLKMRIGCRRIALDK